MSDNTNGAQQEHQMKEIFVCDDVWLDLFGFCSRFELGQTIAVVSDRLDILVDLHFKKRLWSLCWLEIRLAAGETWSRFFKGGRGKQPLPVPHVPIPSTCAGFEWIQIRYIDQTVIDFLQRVRPLFESTAFFVHIRTGDAHRHSWQSIGRYIWPLVNGNIRGLNLGGPRCLARFRHFSPSILRSCSQLQTLSVFGLRPNFSTADDVYASNSQAVTEWLLAPRADGLPKMLHCDFTSAGMERLKRLFIDASTPVSFVVWLSINRLAPFELINAWTGERLTLRAINKHYRLLVRCSTERDEKKWTKWEQEASSLDKYPQQNCIIITAGDNEIDDGVGTLGAGPSEPKKPKRR